MCEGAGLLIFHRVTVSSTLPHSGAPPPGQDQQLDCAAVQNHPRLLYGEHQVRPGHGKALVAGRRLVFCLLALFSETVASSIHGSPLFLVLSETIVTTLRDIGWKYECALGQ